MSTTHFLSDYDIHLLNQGQHDRAWEEFLNSDAPLCGGSGQGNLGGVKSSPVSAFGHYHRLMVTLPPLAIVVFRRKGDA